MKSIGKYIVGFVFKKKLIRIGSNTFGLIKTQINVVQGITIR